MKGDQRALLEGQGWTSEAILEPRSVEGILRHVLAASDEDHMLCRGEARFFPESKPTIARSSPFDAEPLWPSTLRKSEAFLIANFRTWASGHLGASDLSMTESIWGTLVLMQHYGSPTRLLDWTYSPWVAAFFAASSHFSEDGFVWLSRLRALHESAAPPDLGEGHKRLHSTRRLVEWQELFNPSNEGRKADNDTIAASRIRLTPGHEQDSEDPTPDVVRPHEWIVPVRPSRATARLTAQQGLFTVGNPIDLDHRAWIGKNVNDSDRRVIVVKSSLKRQLLLKCLRANVTNASLFPGLSGAADTISSMSRVRLNLPGPLDDWVPEGMR